MPWPNHFSIRSKFSLFIMRGFKRGWKMNTHYSTILKFILTTGGNIRRTNIRLPSLWTGVEGKEVFGVRRCEIDNASVFSLGFRTVFWQLWNNSAITACTALNVRHPGCRRWQLWFASPQLLIIDSNRFNTVTHGLTYNERYTKTFPYQRPVRKSPL